MSTLTDVEKVRIKIGLTNPQFPILCDEEIEYLLEEVGGDVRRASLNAAQAALYTLSFAPTRERAGDEEVWQNPADSYRKALEMFIKRPQQFLGNLTPYAAGITQADVSAMNAKGIVSTKIAYPPCNTPRQIVNDIDSCGCSNA